VPKNNREDKTAPLEAPAAPLEAPAAPIEAPAAPLETEPEVVVFSAPPVITEISEPPATTEISEPPATTEISEPAVVTEQGVVDASVEWQGRVREFIRRLALKYHMDDTHERHNRAGDLIVGFNSCQDTLCNEARSWLT
jgi:hypothetical protein